MQSDNTVIVMGKVIKGPQTNYVRVPNPSGEGELKEKIRVKYQIRIATRPKDSNQIFTVWVRTLGNQAMKDKENIKTGDVVLVSGRLATRLEESKHYLYLAEDDFGNKSYQEVDIEDEVTIERVGEENIFPFKSRRFVTEIQANDVQYLTNIVSQFDEKDIKKLFGEERFEKLSEGVALYKAQALKKMKVVPSDVEENWDE